MKRAVLAALLVLVLAGCSATKDASGGGDEFQFVAPGGQLTITYDPPSTRHVVTGISGESLLHPGKTVGLDDYAGKVVVLNIWGSWCGPCRTEAPDLQFVHDQTAPVGAAVLGIDVRDDRAAATDFVTDGRTTYDSIYDNPGRVLAQLHGYPRNAVPSTLVLDKQHRVAAVYLTAIKVAELIPTVQRLAAE